MGHQSLEQVALTGILPAESARQNNAGAGYSYDRVPLGGAPPHNRPHVGDRGLPLDPLLDDVPDPAQGTDASRPIQAPLNRQILQSSETIMYLVKLSNNFFDYFMGGASKVLSGALDGNGLDE